MDELKPCPFCGGKKYIEKQTNDYGSYVICRKCGSASGFFKMQKEAVEAWNSRQIEDALQKKLDESREDNAENMEYHVEERERLKKEIEELRGCVAFSERLRILELLKSCCNEFAPRNSAFPVCCRNEWGVDAQGHCLGRDECPIYAELTKGEKV